MSVNLRVAIHLLYELYLECLSGVLARACGADRDGVIDDLDKLLRRASCVNMASSRVTLRITNATMWPTSSRAWPYVSGFFVFADDGAGITNGAALARITGA